MLHTLFYTPWKVLFFPSFSKEWVATVDKRACVYIHVNPSENFILNPEEDPPVPQIIA